MVKHIKLKRKRDPNDWRLARFSTILFSPLGMYPRGTFCTPYAMFHADDDIVFAATYGARWSATHEDLPYSEVDWLEPEVVRLLGALMMTEQFPEGLRCRFYPSPHSGFTLNEEVLDLSDSRMATAIKRAMLRTVNNRLWPKYVHDRMNSLLGKKFHLFDPVELSIECFERYWKRLSTDNHVLMRGIQALVKSDMLAAHPEFREESTIATFIALDASHELVLRHLRENGIVNPSSTHAGDWLYKTFDEPMGVHGAAGLKYFEEFYAQRVQTVHPGSRYGDVPFAPVMADDYIHLRQALPGVFGYLVLGEHTPFFWKEVAERRARLDAPVPNNCAGNR